GAPIKGDLRAGFRLAAHQTALLDRALEHQRAGPGRCGDEHGEERGGDASHSNDPWPGEGVFFRGARGCFAASSAVTVSLPSWKMSVSASPAATPCAESTTLPG